MTEIPSKHLVSLLVAGLLVGCGLSPDSGSAQERASSLESCPAPSGGWDDCSAVCPCAAEQGDCDSDDECTGGAVCMRDMGGFFGWDPEIDVCMPLCTDMGVGTGDFCSAQCPCEAGEADCDDDSDCAAGLVCAKNVGASFGFAPDVDVCVGACDPVLAGGWDYCSEACPCEHGQGDCDQDADCAPGSVCVDNVGGDYGHDEDMDVCVTLEPFAGRVLNALGQRLAGVEVTVDGQTAITGEDGAFAFAVLPGARHVISATRIGFVPYSRVHLGTGMDRMAIVLREAETFEVAPGAAIDIEDSRGTSIVIGANALVDEDGNLPVGTLYIHVHSHDLHGEPMLGTTMEAIDSNGNLVALESLGAVSVDIVDAAGRRYQLAPGQRARIALTVPDGVVYSGEIPMWHYDMAQGRWLEEGVGQVQGQRAVAEVSHFSTWNFDFKVAETACVKVLPRPPLVSIGERVRARVVVSVPSSSTRERQEDLIASFNSVDNLMINLPPHARVDIYIPPNAEAPMATVDDVGAGWGGTGIPGAPLDDCAQVEVKDEITLSALTSAPEAGSSDGFARFGADEFGTICPCTGIGIRFDPLGEHGDREVLAVDRLYVFDQNQQWRQALSRIAGSGQWCEAPIVGMDEALFDTTIDGVRRVSEFVLPAKPDITVHLVQTADGATLTQEYEFINNGQERVDMVLTRVSDIDLVYTVHFKQNTGVGMAPNGATVLSSDVGPSMTIEALGDAQLDGWRIFQRIGGWGASEHLKAWAGYGFAASLLNGIFLNQHGLLCEPDEALIDTPVPADTAATVQSRLSLEPGERGTFVTRTILSPGIGGT